MSRKKPTTRQRARSLKSAPPANLPAAEPRRRLIDGDSAHRKDFPLFEGLLAYFPDACAYVAHISKKGNDKHNPGQAMHHARSKSGDHADCIMRHLSNHGGYDEAGLRESGGVAWRAMALLQEEIERDMGLPLPRNAKA